MRMVGSFSFLGPWIASVSFVLFILVFGNASEAAPRKIKIVATTGMIADVARNLAEERADVVQLIGSGVDPHLYRPTRSDIAALTSADIVFYNGLLLEGRMTDALVRIARTGRPVYAVSERLKPEYLIEPTGFAGHYDPHVWMDPVAWSETVDVVKDALISFDSPNLELYTVNAEAYSKQLADLQNYSAKTLATVPPDKRVLITAHDAFNYFARRYGFKVLGIQGLSTESEAGVKDIEHIISFIVKNKIPAVFIESTISDRNVKALIEGTSVQGHKIVIGGSLFSDAMGPPGTYEGTYVGMIDHNVTTITSALSGEAPVRGMLGQLTVKAE